MQTGFFAHKFGWTNVLVLKANQCRILIEVVSITGLLCSTVQWRAVRRYPS
jgi:hypothetical protein